MSALALAVVPAADSLEALRSRVKEQAQRRPGIYQFHDAAGGIFYVGKAKDLRARLLSYFTAAWPDTKASQLIRAAADITWHYLPSEFAALLEELRLIARLRPFSNVRGTRTLRRVVFVKVTAGAAPKLKVTEQTTDRTARYYGPFQGSFRTADGVRVMSDLLQLRDCAQDRTLVYADQADLFGASGMQVGCIRHELGTCLGPCAGKCSAAAYRASLDAAVDFLEGRAVQPMDRILDAMAEASGARDYERAAHWRDKLETLEGLFAAVSRLRAATDALSFVYGVRDRTAESLGGGHDDRVYLIHRGVVRAEAAWPRTPIEREAFAKTVERFTTLPPGTPVARTAPEMDQLALVMSWFRQNPDEFDATTPFKDWAAPEEASACDRTVVRAARTADSGDTA
jgi:excinuclease ABC subunit C